MYGRRCNIAEKAFTFNLNGVTVGLCEGATADNLLVDYGTSKIESAWVGKEAIAPYFINLTDCVIDLETVKPASNINVFNLSVNGINTNYMSNNITVYGGEIKAENLENINFVTEAHNSSSLSPSGAGFHCVFGERAIFGPFNIVLITKSF